MNRPNDLQRKNYARAWFLTHLIQIGAGRETVQEVIQMLQAVSLNAPVHPDRESSHHLDYPTPTLDR